MRRLGVLAVLMAAVGLVAAFAVGSSAAAGSKKLVEGTVYDTTCGVSCSPCPPVCGPIPAPQTKGSDICAALAQRRIVCPLQKQAKRICLPQTPCGEDGTDPVYSGEGAIVNVRKRGSATVLAKLPVVEGHFKTRLARGEYVLTPHLPEPECWSGVPEPVKITAKLQGPLTVPISVGNSCVAHPDAG